MSADPPTGLAILVCSVFVLLGFIHFYWALGGSRGRGRAIPEAKGRPLFRPGPKATLAVGLCLVGAGVLVLGGGGLLGVPGRALRLPIRILSLVFLLRAMGDFRFVGFFKRTRGTPFARWDTWLFSPLCLALAAGCALVAG